MNRINKLELNKFNMREMLTDSTVLVIGKRRSGKSFLIRDMFYHKQDIPMGIVFSGTESASPFFGDFIPDSFIYSEYSSDLMEAIFNKQKQKLRKFKERKKGDDKGKCKENNFFIVLDDMLHDASSWKKDKSIKSLFMNGRHYNVMGIVAVQYALGIPPDLRNNIDYVFIFNEPSIKNRKKIYEDYCSMIPTFDEFCNILDSCTRNYECLVVKTTGGSSNKIEDHVFWYKAEPHKNFRVGSKKIWEYHNKTYNRHYDKDYDIMQEQIIEEREKYKSSNKLKLFVNKTGDVTNYKVTH